MTEKDDDGTIYERFREEFLRNRSLWQEWREVGESLPFRLLNALSKKLNVPSGYLDLYTVSKRDDWITHSDGPLTPATSMDSASMVTDDGEWRFKLGLLLEPTVLTAAGTFKPKSPTLFEVKMFGSNKVHAIDTSKPQPFEEICSDIIELIEVILRVIPTSTPVPPNQSASSTFLGVDCRNAPAAISEAGREETALAFPLTGARYVY